MPSQETRPNRWGRRAGNRDRPSSRAAGTEQARHGSRVLEGIRGRDGGGADDAS